MAQHRRIRALTAIGVTGILGVGSAIGISAAEASAPATAVRAATVSAVVREPDRIRAHRLPVGLVAAHRAALLRALRARVVAAVLAKFPKAKVIAVVRHREGTWLVVLRLKDGRVGTVTVNRHLKVGTFHRLSPKVVVTTHRHPTTGHSSPPSSTGKIGGDGAVSGPHW